jgi:hypothetical protein
MPNTDWYQVWFGNGVAFEPFTTDQWVTKLHACDGNTCQATFNVNVSVPEQALWCMRGYSAAGISGEWTCLTMPIPTMGDSFLGATPATDGPPLDAAQVEDSTDTTQEIATMDYGPFCPADRRCYHPPPQAALQ